MAIEEFYASITGNADGLIRAAGEGEAAAGSLETRMGVVNSSMSTMGVTGGAAVRDTTKDVSLLDRAFGGVFGSIKSVVGGLVSMVGQTAGIGAIFGGAAGLVEGVKYAQEYNQEMALLTAAYTAQGQAMPTQQINAMIDAQTKLGFTEDESQKSLLELAQAHIPLNQQQNAMAVASDLARAKGLSLSSALDLLLKAAQGTGRGLQDLGINLPAVVPKTAALASATAAAAKAQQAYQLALDKYGQGSSQAVTAHEKLDAATLKVSTDTKAMSDHFSQLAPTLQQVETRVSGAAVAYKAANPFATMGADLQAVARVGGQAFLPFLDNLAKDVSSNEPAIASFVKNGVQALATAAEDAGGFIANDLYPPVKDVIGFLVSNKGVVEGVVASLAGLYVVKKGASAAGSVLGDLKELFGGKGVILNAVHALTGLGSGSSSSSGLVGSLKPVNVYVTNWEQMGGGGLNPTSVAADGGIIAAAATAATTALAALGAVVVIGDIALAFNKGKGTSVLNTSDRGSNGQDPGDARFGALVNQQQQQYVASLTQQESYAKAAAKSSGLTAQAAATLEKDVADGEVKGKVQIDQYVANWKSANSYAQAILMYTQNAALTASDLAGDLASLNASIPGTANMTGRGRGFFDQSSGGTINGDVHINVPGTSDPEATALAVRNALLQLQRRGALNGVIGN